MRPSNPTRSRLVIPVPEELKQLILSVANDEHIKVEDLGIKIFEDFVARQGRYDRRSAPRDATADTKFPNEWFFTGRDLAG